SSPGRQGFFMAVTASGKLQGSIGGGVMEHKFTEMAKDQLSVHEDTISLHQQIHDKAAPKNQSGMICSGRQTILLYRVRQEDALTIGQIIGSLEQVQTGILKISPSGLQFFLSATMTKDFLFTYVSEDEWEYKEKTGFKNQLFIIGGGHCSLALSRIMSSMDFYIRVYETRTKLHTLEQNGAAHEKIIIPDYSQLSRLITPNAHHHYVVVMTLGYRTDDIAVRALMTKSFKYFGLLGSKTKNGQLLASYAAAGISAELLNRIHSPIGLAIHSQTPEEIAVSIAAEIIQVKNNA
ncbi:MAG TPA: XdhC family protein, partial [Chitinophagaceae bacterium]